MSAKSFQARMPLQHWHQAHNAHFNNTDGWNLPALYATKESEKASARTSTGIADVSAFSKISLIGNGVAARVSRLFGGPQSLQPLQVVALPEDSTTLICHLTNNHLMILARATAAAAIATRLDQLSDNSLVRSDVTSAYAGFCLIGPHVEQVLCNLTAHDTSEVNFPPATCAETSLAGVHAILVRPAGQRLATFFVYVAWDLGEYVWDNFIRVGGPANIHPIGLETLRELLDER